MLLLILCICLFMAAGGIWLRHLNSLKQRQPQLEIINCEHTTASAQPLVSIVMAAYNNAGTIKQTIASILQQTYSNWELIIIDDGSSDATVAVVKAFNDPRIQIFQDGLHFGLPKRLNMGLDLAQGKYIARMDSDDICYPQRLQLQVEYLEAHPDIDLLGSSATVFNNAGEALGVFPTFATHQQICSSPWSGFYLAHPTWMGRASWYKKYRYNETNLYAQDQDLLLHAYKHSRFACLPQMLIGYRQQRISIRKSLLGRYYFSTALIRYGVAEGAYLKTLAAVSIQFIKFCIDAVVVTLHLDRKLLVHRALPIKPEEAAAWAQCWQASQNSGSEKRQEAA